MIDRTFLVKIRQNKTSGVKTPNLKRLPKENVKSTDPDTDVYTVGTHPSSMSMGVPRGARSSAATSWETRVCDWEYRLRARVGLRTDWA